ncbi:type II secretion system F family protein [Grimontia sp. SpTr1]|uniref:type II secretion system F family protein n=1 Tax=Grimontia sp. SpTr1 TaxID=2995319 RepID=UPI00248C677E|nr:type II secretion system F family protein [Grimontia sp. SpTr1]
MASLSLILLILAGVLFFAVLWRQRKRLDFLAAMDSRHDEHHEVSAMNLQLLGNLSVRQRLSLYCEALLLPLGERPLPKVILYYLMTLFAAIVVNSQYLALPTIWIVILWPIPATVGGMMMLQSRARKQFEQSFPDALTILTGAISAGESLMHSVIFVGKTLDTPVGKEFKRMGERLQIGEPPDEVLQRASLRMPFKEFIFFSITLRANISRGGQLKDVISRLNRLMFDSRAMETKKMAMTSEARMSAKIVCAIPFAFMFLMRYLSPENLRFVMEDPSGRYILYYLLASEAIGMGIIAWLMRGVR